MELRHNSAIIMSQEVKGHCISPTISVMLSSSRAALGILRRMPVPGPGLRITLAGLRFRISGRVSRRSHYREEQDYVKTSARPTARQGYRLKDYVEALIAGGSWNNATNAGSRSRHAQHSRWIVDTHIGARFASEPL